jgi:HEAT repeat protein
VTPARPAADLSALFHEDPDVRSAAIRAVPPGRDAWFALRSLLLFDVRAEHRAHAAERLAEAKDLPDVVEWLRDALGDPLPSVRQAAFLALGKLGNPAAQPWLEQAALEEPVWWVRRSAVQGLAACCGPRAVSALRQVLEDPTWRVRFSALRALAAMGEMEASGARTEVARSASEWLAGAGPHPVAPSIVVDDGLFNADPAVVTARLEDGQAKVPPLKLVALLADPHAPLREAAGNLLLAAPDLTALAAALSLLRDPRASHGPTAVRDLLNQVDIPVAQALVRIALSSAGNEGAAVWAVGWIGANGDEALQSLLASAARDPRPSVRRAAIVAWQEVIASGRATSDEVATQFLTAALADPDSGVRSAAVCASVESERPWSQDLAQLDCADLSVKARAALVLAAARASEAETLHRLGDDPHGFVRASAVEALDAAGLLTDRGRRAAAGDRDPWVRTAALTASSAVAALEKESDPQLRRAALNLLIQERHSCPASLLAQAAELAARAKDPWLRTRGVALLDVAEARDLRLLLQLSRDPERMVRAACVDVFDRMEDLSGRMRSLLTSADLPEELQLAAWGLLARDESPQTAAALELALESASARKQSALVEHLRAITLVLPEGAMAAAPRLAAQVPTPEPMVVRPKRGPRSGPEGALAERRPLGRTGISVAPLGISGVYQLPADSFDYAFNLGANLFFWEPHYLTLSRYIRMHHRSRPGMVIAAGTFGGSPRAIRKDVETALRRLRTDYLDLFQIFWVRSPERLSDECWQTMARLKSEGLIRAAGFSTHHRDLAQTAIASHPWDAVMLRYSAAHPGAEKDLLPASLERGVGVLGFSSLCYGRLLRRAPGEPADLELPTASACYRYCLTSPGVSAVVSAPRRHGELLENLEVLSRPTLSPPEHRTLAVHGAAIHAENNRFNTMVRQAGRTEELVAPDLLRLSEELEFPLAAVEAEWEPPAKRKKARSPRSNRV